MNRHSWKKWTSGVVVVMGLALPGLVACGPKPQGEDRPASPGAAPVHWFEADFREDAFGIAVTYQLGSGGDILTAAIDINNGGDLPVVYRGAYDPAEPGACHRSITDNGVASLLSEPFSYAEVGGAAGTAASQVMVLHPGFTRTVRVSVAPGDVCGESRPALLDVRPAQWRACLGVVQLPAEYATGGSRQTYNDQTMSLPEGLAPVLLCSQPATVPPEWYDG